MLFHLFNALRERVPGANVFRLKVGRDLPQPLQRCIDRVVVRPAAVEPQEVVAALQALAQAYTDYYTAVADYDRAQFRLYHALGHPAQAVTAGDGEPPDPPTPARATFGAPVPCP